MDRAGDQHRVRDRDLLVAHVHDLGRQRRHFHDHAFDVVDANEVAAPQGARVDHHQAAHRLGHEARGAERQHQAEQHRQALEGVAVRARDERIGDRDAEQPGDDRHDAARRSGRFGVQVGQPQSTRLHVVEEVPEHVDDRARHAEHDQHRDQTGQSGDQSPAEPCQRVDDELAEAMSDRLRQREPLEHVRGPGVAEDEKDQPLEDLRDAHEEAEQELPERRARVPRGDRVALALEPADAAAERAAEPVDERREDRGGDRGPHQRVEHDRRAAGVQPDAPDFLEVGQGLLDQRVVRLVDRRDRRRPRARRTAAGRPAGSARPWRCRAAAARCGAESSMTSLGRISRRRSSARCTRTSGLGARQRGAHRDHVAVQHAQDGGSVGPVGLVGRRLGARDRQSSVPSTSASAQRTPSSSLPLMSALACRCAAARRFCPARPVNAVTATRQPRPSRRPIRVR